jgi:hypothetical protein
MDEERPDVTRRKQKPRSPFRKLIYLLVMMATSGGAGALFKDHPAMQALFELLAGRSPSVEGGDGGLGSSLARVIKKELNRDDARKPGVYRVTISEIKLDPRNFKDGHKVDIQARVVRTGADGRSTTVWRSEPYGENLSVVGRDDLSATFPNRPFEVEWSPGDRIAVEVWDRKGGFFERKDLKMALSEPGVFPLASGTHALEVEGRSGRDSDLNLIVFESRRVGDAGAEKGPRPAGKPSDDSPSVLAERPIIIK